MTTLLTKTLWKNQPRRELMLATAGCFVGTFLLLAAVQFQSDATFAMDDRKAPANFFSINKKITGSGIENHGKNYDFNESEIAAIQKRPEILELGTFARSRFAVTLHLWPAGRPSFLLPTKAAKADVFFESVPNEFIDEETSSWKWNPGDSTIPLIIPKFYLDLWNLGFAPTRKEYPTVGAKDALRMPIDVFIGNPPEVMLKGKFVAFSRRINGILVPENFLRWANETYAPDEDRNSTSSSRLIARTKVTPERDLINFLEVQDYELNREMPEADGFSNVILWAFLIVAGIGVALSLLSIATFAASFRLIVTRSSERITNLLHLGFEDRSLSQVYVGHFFRLFGFAMACSLVALWITKGVVDEKLASLSIAAPVGLADQTIVTAILYAFVFAIVNLTVIRNAVRKLN
ncbi:MAG: hypothetical protein VB980_03065 [Opitutales bacterium]|jgi:hypothetical protein